MSFIRSFGAYLPDSIVTNEQLAVQLNCTAEWIRAASGIRERRQAGPDETLVEMASRAGKDCLNRVNASPHEVAMLIVASGTAPRRFPGPAAETAATMGLQGVATLDVPMASAGALWSMVLADAFAPRYGNVLIVAAERMTEIAWRPPADPNTAILFGDGAGACLVSKNSGMAQIVDHTLKSDGSFARDLRLEHDGSLAMEGRSVILHASRKVPAAINLLLERNGWPAGELDVLLMHQANQNLMNRVAQSVGIAQERVFSVIEETGNTSSASMLIAAAQWSLTNAGLAGKHMAFAAFGAGFHWGALLTRGT